MIPSESFLFISFCVLSGYLALFGTSFFRSYAVLRKIFKDPVLRIFFTAISVVLLTWLLAVFPGFISSDDFVAVEGIKNGQVTIWTSIVYGYLLSGFKLADLEFGGPVVLTVFFYWLVIIRTFEHLFDFEKKSKVGLAVIGSISIVAIWPTLLAYLTYQNRDSLYAVLLANLFFVLCDLRPQKNRSVLATIEVVAYTTLISLMRQDGLLLGALVILYLLITQILSKKEKIVVAASFLMLITGNSLLSTRQAYWHPLAKQYQAVPYLTTMSAILNSPFIDSPSLKELEIYYDFDCVKNLKEENWYSNARGRCLKYDAVNTLDSSFYFSLVNVFQENIDVVVSHYSEKFIRTFNQSMLIQSVLISSTDNASESQSNFSFKTSLFRYLKSYHSFANTDFGFSFLLFSLAVTITSLFVLRGNAQILLLIFNTRIPILFLFAPDPQSKYFFTLCTLLPISIVLIFKRYFMKNESQTSPMSKQ